MQSVKPPVEEPTSVQTLSFTLTSKFAIAFSNFKPPLLTYGSVCPRTSILTSSGNVLPALSSLCPSTKTFPDIMIAFAFSLDSARFLFTSNTSKRSFIFFSFQLHIFINYLLYDRIFIKTYFPAEQIYISMFYIVIGYPEIFHAYINTCS